MSEDHTSIEMPKKLPERKGDDTVDVTIVMTRFQYETLRGVASCYTPRFWLEEIMAFEFMNHPDARVCSKCGWECWPVTVEVNHYRFSKHSNVPTFDTMPMCNCQQCGERLTKKDTSPIFELYGPNLRHDRWLFKCVGMKHILDQLKKLRKPASPKLLEAKPAKKAVAS